MRAGCRRTDAPLDPWRFCRNGSSRASIHGLRREYHPHYDVGDVVEWRNRDIVDHTATGKDGSFDVAIEAGGNGKLVMQKPGEIEYFCRYHPNMTGKINVIGEP
jgi:hypothetical protein